MPQQRSPRRSPAKKTTDREMFERTLEIAERLAAQVQDQEQRQSAAAAGERHRRETLAGLPPLTSAANIDARMARLAEIVGEPTFAPAPGKFDGITDSVRRRIDEARRRAGLRAPKAVR